MNNEIATKINLAEKVGDELTSKVATTWNEEDRKALNPLFDELEALRDELANIKTTDEGELEALADIELYIEEVLIEAIDYLNT